MCHEINDKFNIVASNYINLATIYISDEMHRDLWVPVIQFHSVLYPRN